MCRYSTHDKPIEFARDPALDNAPKDIDYRPQTLKDDIKRLVEERDFSTAASLLDAVYIDEQIRFENKRDQFFAIGGNRILVPGATRDFDRTKDWIIPNNDESIFWILRAERFARAYNSRLSRDGNSLLPRNQK